VTLNATDAGSGVASTRYTTDGSDPLASTSATTYASPFSVPETATLRFASLDVAGNQEPVRSQTIRVDGAPPTVALTAPASGSIFTKGTKVTVSATAIDKGTGAASPSGVATVSFYLDGATRIGTDSATPYQLVWNTRKASFGGHTLTTVAVDVAENQATSPPINVSIVR
jgi:hypothetical protein